MRTAKVQKVIEGLECCIKQGEQGIFDCNTDCPYGEQNNRHNCWIKLNRDALALIKSSRLIRTEHASYTVYEPTVDVYKDSE